MERLTLTQRELWQSLGISSNTYYRLKEKGLFKHLESPVPNRYSKAKVEAWVNGKAQRPWLQRAS